MNHERAVLAGGCFWGMQDLIRRYEGVVSTRVGYTGGDTPNPTYRNHGAHAEAIEIIIDPSKISFRSLLEFFFQIHDPTTLNSQGGDRGTIITVPPFSTQMLNKGGWRKMSLPMSMLPDCGPEKWLRRLRPLATSGRLMSRNIRIT